MSAVRLVVMRLIDMTRMHPSQDNSKVCALCGERVGIYPSGQLALKANPTIEIACSVCSAKDYDPVEDKTALAAPVETIVQESRDSYAVKKA
jgi:hypothetical protein